MKSTLFNSILVTNKAIITAAHCIIDKGAPSKLSTKYIFAVVGQTDIQDVADDDDVLRPISNVILHPDWEKTLYLMAYEADIAIAFLEKSLEFSKSIAPICLPGPTDDVPKNQKGSVAGWGYDERNRLAEKLKIADLFTEKHEVCAKADRSLAESLTSKTFCTEKSRSGPCKGL